jgi:amino acid transporter
MANVVPKESSSVSSFAIDATDTSSENSRGFRSFCKSFKLSPPGSTSNGDIEKGEVYSLEDNLKEYQVRLIALSGCIGSGLFISSASALSTAGPGGCVIGYTIIATLVFFVIQSLGELTCAYPVRGNFLVYNSRFIDESWGFAMNWNYCIQWLVSIPLSLVSASLTIEFWGSSINPSVWVAIFFSIICAINIFGVKGYGIGESVFSVIKVTAMIGFCILGIVLVAGGGEGGYIGGKHWRNPGSFANGFRGTCNTLVNAAFSFAGTELVAIAAGSSANPRRTLKNAIKQVFWRISIFYMLSIILVCFLVPYNDENLLGNSGSSASPFVIAIKNGGISVLPSIFNAVILIAVLSVANASVFASYKPLVALAEAGHGPKFLTHVDRKGRPMYAILICLSFGLIAFVCSSDKQTIVFNWLLAISGLATIFIWFSIALAQVRVNYAFKVQGIVKSTPYKALGGDFGAYLGMLINVLVLMAQFYVGLYPIGGPSLDANTFFQAYLAAPIVLVFYLGHKIWTRNWSLYIRAEDMDITTGVNIVDHAAEKERHIADNIAWKKNPWYYRFYHTWC